MKKITKTILLTTLLMTAFSSQANKIGEVTTSGFMFKDSIEIHSFNDPTLSGVSCHITYADKSFSFDDPSNSSISCRQTNKVISGNYSKHAKNIFSKSKNLFFKSMRVDRFYDKENHSLIYISYVKKLKGDNASHSISSVPLFNATLK